MEILSIVWTFFKIGIVSFGGGWSIVGLIKTEVVPRWLDEGAFSSLIAIAQATPGPIALNTATLVGWKQGGIVGALAATIAVTAFPLMAIVTANSVAVRLASKGKLPDHEVLDQALKTAAIAMMMMTLWTLRPRSAEPLLIGLGVGAFALTAFTKLSPLWAILGAGAIKALVGLLSSLL